MGKNSSKAFAPEKNVETGRLFKKFLQRKFFPLPASIIFNGPSLIFQSEQCTGFNISKSKGITASAISKINCCVK